MDKLILTGYEKLLNEIVTSGEINMTPYYPTDEAWNMIITALKHEIKRVNKKKIK